MKKISYKTQSTCSTLINIVLDDNNIIRDIDFVNGCDGNLKGICALVKNKSAIEIIDLLEGITCGKKSTSCPDQVAKALKENI